MFRPEYLGARKGGKNTLPNFPILFKHKTAIGYYDLSIVVSDRAQSNRSDNIGLQDRTFAPKMGVSKSDIEDPPSLIKFGVQKLRTRKTIEYCHI